MAHGVPLDAGAGEEALGVAGAHMLDVGLSSTERIAAFFKIAPAEATRPAEAPPPGAKRAPSARPRAAVERTSGPQAAIEKALRAAGLMR
jgi:hypothetical protein